MSILRPMLAILFCLLPVALFAQSDATGRPSAGRSAAAGSMNGSTMPSTSSGNATNTIDSQADGYATGLGHTPSSSSNIQMSPPKVETADPTADEGDDSAAHDPDLDDDDSDE